MKLFDSLLQAPDVEIIEAALPEARQRILGALSHSPGGGDDYTAEQVNRSGVVL